uniref:Coiled-coil domain-containing protein n=2 Tax=Schistosoma japonicum TaxID=6182 RepID=C1LM13_SCHJA|nr:hypothetical protein [Schistosoma japonicum]
MFSNILFFIFFHSMVMYCNGVEDEGEYLPPEVKQAVRKYSDGFYKFHNLLYKILLERTNLRLLSRQKVVKEECSRLEYRRSAITAIGYLTEQNLADKSLLYTFEGRLERTRTNEKTTMLAVDDHKLLIELSEEKWRARKDLNEVEKKYFVQTRQNTNKSEYKLSLNLRDANDKVSAQIRTMKPILLNAVIAVIKYRKDSNNKEFLKEEEKSRKKLNDALNSLTDMIEEAQYRRFKFYKTLTYEDRIYRLVRAMDKEREICQILDMSLSGSISESTIYTRITSP